MVKLGHIRYSNCIPVHGRLLQDDGGARVQLIHGVPGELNAKLAAGEIDVAPASSVEFARHADRYRILPGLSISARGPVQTIQLISRKPLEDLEDDTTLALPTSSATSVVLVKIIMSQRLGIRPRYRWFDEECENPLDGGASAALYIGDAAHRERRDAGRCCYDLAALWRDWTGCPFVFALWQTSAGTDLDAPLRHLVGEILDSRDWSLERLPWLADRYADEYGWEPAELVTYWRSLAYDWSDDLQGGLAEFYRRAAEIGEVPSMCQPVFLEV